jgi:dihydroxyacetone synthase
MPHVLFLRPADTEEVAGAFQIALEKMGFIPDSYQNETKPHEEPLTSIISLSRHSLVQLHKPHSSHPLPGALTSRSGVHRGAYAIHTPSSSAKVTLLSTGSELALTLAIASLLESKFGLAARVVSFPCQALFDKQSAKYKSETLPRRKLPTVIIEAYALRGWERYADAGWGMTSFGRSGPGKNVYQWFGFESQGIAAAIKEWITEGEKSDEEAWWLGTWTELSQEWKWAGK